MIKKWIMRVLLLLVSMNMAFAVKRTVIKPLPQVEIKKAEPVKEQFNEAKAILNHIRNEGYKEKSDIRETRDMTMEEGTKEIEGEKAGTTYTLFVKADKETETVEIVDTLIREYYDILEEIRKSNSEIRKIEVATYALGTDIMLYTKGNMMQEEYRRIGREIAAKIRAANPLVNNMKILMYTPYNFDKPLLQESF